MTLKSDGRLARWIVEALEAHDGSASIVEICTSIYGVPTNRIFESPETGFTHGSTTCDGQGTGLGRKVCFNPSAAVIEDHGVS